MEIFKKPEVQEGSKMAFSDDLNFSHLKREVSKMTFLPLLKLKFFAVENSIGVEIDPVSGIDVF